MKNRNSILSTITARSFKANRTRNRVAVLAIALTTLMFTSLFVLSQSMTKNLIEMTFRQSGYDAQVSFKSITEEQAEKISSHPDVEELGNSIVMGLAENQKLSGRQLEIRWGDDSYASHSFAFPTTGTMPGAADEVALDTLVLDRLGIPHTLGEAVTLEWRKDPASDEITSSTFTLCGYWDGNQSAYASMAWVSRTFADEMTAGLDSSGESQILGLHMAQVSLKSDSHIEETMDDILKDLGLSGLRYSMNLAYSPEMNASATQETIPMYLGMVLVFIAGYLIIYNIFQISVTADIQFYGQLKTLGTTTKQIKKIIYGQADRLCLIGIPAGLVLGYLLGMVLVPVMLGMMDGQISVSANPFIFIGSTLFAWLTVLISCLRPARLAGKVSPIEALRYNDSGTSSKKKTKKSRKGASLPGMAFANLGRNKKRTVLVISSLSLGLVLLSCFYAKNASFDMEKYLSGLTISDFELSDSTHEDRTAGYNPKSTTLNQDLSERVEALKGLAGVGHMYSSQLPLEIDNQTLQNLKTYYTEDILKEWSSYDKQGAQAAAQAMEDKKAAAVVYGLDGIPLDTIVQEQYLLKGDFDAEKFSTGKYVLALAPAIEKDSIDQNTVLPTASIGSEVIIGDNTYTVMANVFPVNSIANGAVEDTQKRQFHMSFIIPSEHFKELWPDHTLRKLFFNVDDQEIAAAQKMLDDYTRNVDTTLPVTSRKTMEEQYNEETRASTVIGNAISIVIALVGILNFVNSMVTAIVSRKKEFAMIQSIGMTKRQLCRMLVFEGLFYAGFTLLVSYTLSSLTVGTIIRAMAADGYATFRFTLFPLFVCTPVILALAVLIPYACFKNLEKQSIVERLRME